jgi:rubrerythrin
MNNQFCVEKMRYATMRQPSELGVALSQTGPKRRQGGSMLESKGNSGLLTTLEANWQAEMKDRATYEGFAARELNARRRNVMRGLAATEQHHAELWADRIRALGGP